MKKILITILTAVMLMATVLPAAPEAQAQPGSLGALPHWEVCSFSATSTVPIDSIIVLTDTGQVSKFSLGKLPPAARMDVTIVGSVDVALLTAGDQNEVFFRELTIPNECKDQPARLLRTLPTFLTPLTFSRPALRIASR